MAARIREAPKRRARPATSAVGVAAHANSTTCAGATASATPAEGCRRMVVQCI